MRESKEKTARNANSKDYKTLGRRSKLRTIIALSIVAAILVTIGAFYYQLQVAPFRQPVLTVDNTVIRMDYFLKRTKMAGSDPVIVLEQLTYEQIVKTMATQYGIEASQSDIDQALRSQAAIANGNASDNATQDANNQLTDNEFKEWYHQQLQITGLSDAEYRDIVRTTLLAARFQAYLADTVSTRAEQVHLHVIVSGTSADINKAKARITAGETFATVASEVSLDGESKANSGDIGWIPRGLIPYDDIVFQLDIGQVSDPVLLNANASGTRQYAIFMVSEKDPDRQIDDTTVQVLRSMALYSWLRKEIPQHAVEYNFSTETQGWVSEQLMKVPKN